MLYTACGVLYVVEYKLWTGKICTNFGTVVTTGEEAACLFVCVCVWGILEELQIYIENLFFKTKDVNQIYQM